MSNIVYLVTNQITLYDSSLYKIIPLEDSIELLKGYQELGLDTETEGLDPFTKKLLLLQLGNYDFQILFDINSYGGKIPITLKNYLNTTDTLFILQNAKFDLKFLFTQDVIIKNVYDTMLAEIILTNGLQYSGRDLETICFKYCGVHLDKSVRGDIITKGLSDKVLLYSSEDVKYLPLIKEKQLEQIHENDLLGALNLDNSFVVVLAYIEYCGIKLDYNKWKLNTDNNISKVKVMKEALDEFIYNDNKEEFLSPMLNLWTGKREVVINWDSPKQVTSLFKSYGINTIIKERGEEKESIDAKVLSPQKKDFPILTPYLEYKEVQKEISTYGYNWKNYINPVTNRIHTSYKQLMDTGRLSSGDKRENKPNMQNIPSTYEFRGCFVPEKGCIMIDADYSSQETIVLANHSKEPGLMRFYARGLKDMHSYIAFLMYPQLRICSTEDVSKEALEYISENYPDKRQIAKAAGFAIAYGGNGSTIAKNCNIPKKDGEFVYNSYFQSFPVMKQYFDWVFNKASKKGYIEFNRVTKRKYFFNKDTTDYFLYKEYMEDRYNKYYDPEYGEKSRNFNKSKSDIQRMSQNYPRMYGALCSNIYWKLGELLET